MPDMERITREFEEYLVRDDPVKLARVKGRHEGVDSARWEIVGVVGFLVIIASLICASLP
jgi:hypothetical protein